MALPSEDVEAGMEPIAIVGMAMRFPGGAHSSQEFWEMLKEGRDGWAPIPKHRYNIDGYYHPDNARAGSIWLKGSHFLAGEYEKSAQVFDAPFFNMTSTEVNGSDPQQLHMLEVSYEALENAGIPLHTLAGSDTSVHVGCFTRDYEAKGGRDPYTGPFYAATGNGQSMLANRISWFMDLRGPSLVIDTACSSSLYAVHLACQSLRTRESKVAIAGGVNLITDPSYMRDLTTMGFLSPDGRCHSFDHRANGYARGDGIAAMVMKTLDQALKDGDTIRGVIRSSGLGQDGRTPGITVPSAEAQADLIRSVYSKAGLSMDKTGYFEAHGTGTPIGDPSELSALGASFGKTRDASNPLIVGSVKTNIGHLEGCAGLAGLIKSVLVIEKGEIPPLANFEKANPRLKLDEWKVALPTELLPWPAEGLRRASVNCFGYGGANSHVVVDDTHNFLKSRGLSGHHQTILPTGEPALVADVDSGFNSSASGSEGGDPESLTPRFKLFVFSSVDPAGLQRNATALARQIRDTLPKEEQDEPGIKPAETETDVDAKFLEDLVYTLATRRSLFDQRAFVVARSSKDLHEQLSKPLPKTRRGAINSNIFFTFTGQGAQWASMGAALRARAPFRQSLSRAEAQLASLGCKWSLIDELIATKDTSRIDEPYLSQPLCTALQLALVDLAAEWKILPRAVVGHSSGEIAAAYAAGYLSHEDAMTVAYWRGVLSADVNNRLQGKTGAMMAVGLSEMDVQPYLDKVPLRTVVVACINSPSSVTLSGDKDKVTELETILQEAGIFARKLRVKTAYHSPHMSTIADDYLAAIAGIETLDGSKRVTMFSSVTGMVLDPTELKPSYWVANMLGTVHFSSAVAALLSQPANPEAKGARRKAVVRYSAVVEMGPAEALKGPLVQVMNGINSRLAASVPYTTLLSRNVDAEQSALAGAANLWAHGLNVDLDCINFPLGSNEPLQSLASLPPYQWNHNKIFHHESAWGKKYLKRSKPRTDLLGMRLDNADDSQPRWHNYIRLSEQPWMGDHRVQQMIVYPGAAMAVQAIEGARELATPSRAIRAVEVRNILFKRGLLVPPGDAFVETAIHFEPAAAASADETCWSFKIFSQSGEEAWGQICSGQVATLYEHNDFGEGERAWKHDLALNADIRQRACRDIAPKSFYRLFDQKMNLQYGPLHRNVTACVAGTEEGYGEVTIPDTKSVMPANFEYPHLIHPATLDSCFHLQALGYLHSLSGEESLVPISVGNIYIDANISTTAGTVFSGYSKGVQGQGGDTIGDIVLSDDQASAPKIVVRGFLSRDLSASTPVGNAMSADVRTRKCTVMQHVPLDAPPSEEEAASVEVVDTTVKAEADNNIESTADNSTSKDEGSKTAIAEEIVVLHGSAAYQDPKCAPAVEELRLALEPHCKTLTNLAMGDLTSGETSQVQGKIVLSLIEVEEQYVSNWSETQFKAFRDVVSAASSVLWLTRGAKAETESGLSFAATTGLLRTVRVEKPQLRLFQLSLAPGSSTLSTHDLALTVRVMLESVLSSATRLEQEYVEVDGQLHVPRLVTDESFHSELNPVGAIPKLTTQEVSQLDGPVRALVPRFSETIRFEAQELTPLGSGDVEVSPTMVTVDAAAFEHRETLGQDAVGVVTAIGDSVTELAIGDRVVVSASETMQFPLRVSCGCVELLPSFINAAAAVTMPTPLTLAQLALVDLGHTAPGQTVLIVGSPDPIGLALIQLADSLGARVFASFENERHRNLLLDHVDLDEQQLIRTTNGIDFADKLRRLNAGRGVDVLIVSTPGDITHQSSSCLAPFGRCVTVGSRQHLATSAPFERGVTISNLDLEHLRRAAPAKVAKAFKQVWARARTGAFHSMLPRRSLDISMFTETHTIPTSVCRPGGAVISIREDSKLVLLPAPPPTLTLDPEATYVLAGGLGGIGRSIAETMVSAGARNIAFISRSGAKADEAKKLLSSLQLRGCTAKAYSCDASSSSAVEAYVKAATERGERIKGVVQCAMVLRDSVFDNMTFEQWTESTRPKIQGSWNLHTHFPKDMDFFIMLSSMAGVIGNPGQANYSAAGTYQDALSVYRRSQGLRSTTIDLGIVSDVGYIAENSEQFERLNYLKPLFVSERDLRILLSAAMLGTTRDGKAVPPQLVTGVGAELLQDGSIGSAMAADLKYSQLHGGGGNGQGDASEDEAVQESLKSAPSLGAACEIIELIFASQIARACSMEVEDIDLEKPMHSFGVDSLAAVEVRNMIYRKVRADVSVFDILSTLPMRRLAVKVVAKSAFVRNDVQVAATEESLE